jgi:hypothetical protein
MDKTRLFIDMDGTIAVWGNSPWEDVCSKGYFKNRPPMTNMIEAVKSIIHNHPQVEVFILSAVITDDHSAGEKHEWLDKYLPEIDRKHRIFSVYGEDKGKYIHQKGDILVDDYSKNLIEWEAKGGKGIKVLNGLNWSKKSWKGDVIFHETNPRLLAESIVLLGTRGIEREREKIVSKKPIKEFDPKEYRKASQKAISPRLNKSDQKER